MIGIIWDLRFLFGATSYFVEEGGIEFGELKQLDADFIALGPERHSSKRGTSKRHV